MWVLSQTLYTIKNYADYTELWIMYRTLDNKQNFVQWSYLFAVYRTVHIVHTVDIVENFGYCTELWTRYRTVGPHCTLAKVGKEGFSSQGCFSTKFWSVFGCP